MDVNQNKKNKRKTIKKVIYITVSFIFSLAVSVLGILVDQHTSINGNVMHLCGIICGVFVLLLVPINLLINKNYLLKFSKMDAKERQDYFLSRRENAEESAKQLLAKLKKIRYFTYAYTTFLVLSAIFVSLTSYMGDDEYIGTAMQLLSLSIINTVLVKIQKPYTVKDIDENETYVDEKEFPTLYALAKKARDTMGCHGDVRIAIIPDNNAGIANIDDVFSVQLGALLLNTLDEKEIYCVLLHEFAHMNWEKSFCEKETRYSSQIYSNDFSDALFPFAANCFLYLATLYATNYDLFKFASTISAESNADKAMCKGGDKYVAASALIKLKYHELYSWECGTYDEVSIFENEKMPDTFFTDECEHYKKKIEENKEFWNSLVDKEILSRSATHPTTKMRIESFGVTEVKTVSTPSSAEYIADAKKALEFSDALWKKFNKEFFEDYRKNYLKSVETVEDWKKNGCPLIMEEYRFVVQALRHMGKNTEAIALCDRAIGELNETEANFAYYMKGNYLIHKYDVEGIPYIYKAMSNHNYIDEGLDMIGRFCCIVGNQEELDKYREKAVEFAQREIDDFSKLETLSPKDNLSTDTLPQDMLKEILDYVKKIDDENIEKIYLVKKQISESFSASVFVIQFLPESSPDDNGEILDKLFNYLDTFSDHQFCLFEYSTVNSVKFDKIPDSLVYKAEK